MSTFMLDTKMPSHVIKGNPPEARKRLAALPMNSIVISAITQAKLLYGLARKGHPAAFTNLIKEFLLRVQVLSWDSNATTVYGDLRASCAASGIALGAPDIMIAAHAAAEKSILITHDKAFSPIPGGILAVEDWIVGA